MELAKQKLDKINEAWNWYFLEYAFCQDRINYSEEVQTNYYGDLYAYFSDTFPLISKEPFGDGRKDHLGNAVALLQAIYVQQDLMDELMIIFGLPRSGSEHKEANRNLRNRLVGHPLSRDKKTKELISTVFMRYDNPENEIAYILYEAPKYLNGQWKRESIDKIIEEHDRYLNRNLDIILRKIKKILYAQRKHLKQLHKKTKSKVFDASIIEDTFLYFEAIADDDHRFKKERLEEYYRRREEHPRYRYSITDFQQTLQSYLEEKIKDIETYGADATVPPPFDPSSLPKIKVTIVRPEDFDDRKIRHKDDLHYEFSKLLQKDHIFGLDYFIRTFSHMRDAAEELANMKAHKHNDTEYFASYYYLKEVMKGKSSNELYKQKAT